MVLVIWHLICSTICVHSVTRHNIHKYTSIVCRAMQESWNRENQLIAQWITTRLWWPFRCQTLFGPATGYARSETVSFLLNFFFFFFFLSRNVSWHYEGLHVLGIYEPAFAVYLTPQIPNDPKPLKFRLNSHVHSEKLWLCCPIVHQWCH